MNCEKFRFNKSNKRMTTLDGVRGELWRIHSFQMNNNFVSSLNTAKTFGKVCTFWKGMY